MKTKVKEFIKKYPCTFTYFFCWDEKDLTYEKIKQEFEELRNQEPIVKQNKNYGTISVKFGFNCGAIEAKLIRDYDGWLEWYESDLKDISLESTIPFISRPNKKRIASLKQYAKESSEDFRWDVFTCIESAIMHLPSQYYPPAAKPRGGSPYGLSWSEMNKIRATARELYIFLKDKPALIATELVERLFEVYGIDEPATVNLRRATMLITERHFDFKVDISPESLKRGVQPEDTFYRKYILCQPLKKTSQYRAGPYQKTIKAKWIKTGRTPLLLPILSELQKS